MTRLELKGTAVAPGIGIGRAWIVVDVGGAKIPRRLLVDETPAEALERFESARGHAIENLQRIQAATAKELGIQDAAIYGAQVAVLQDPDALKEIRRWMEEDHLEPESAVQALIDKFEQLFEALEGGEIKNWAADLRDPWREVLRELGAEGEHRAVEFDRDAGLVAVAEELTPSLVTSHHRHPLAGIVCDRGGKYSHGAVLARSFGIPTVIGVVGAHRKAVGGEPCIVYGDEGIVTFGVDDAQVEGAQRQKEERLQVRAVLREAAVSPGRTADDEPIQVLVNIESPRDLQTFDAYTTAGVGLFRTEFAYMERPSFPSQRDQAEVYASILEKFAGKPVVFRTLDVGGDKQLRYFRTPEEPNPALGWRGLRLSLEWRDLFMMQAAALVEARQLGDARLLLPMVTTLEELRRAKEMVAQVTEMRGGDTRPIPVGVMIEVPAAAMALADLAREADFVSVGTNDLTQYLFAVDRDNPWVADLYQPYHPAHLRVLHHIARTCTAMNVPFSVCGEMAGQLAGALYLVGAGFRSLSMAPPFVPEVKAVLREIPFEELRRLAKSAAACRTSDEAFALLQTAVDQSWGQIVQRAVSTAK